MKKRIVPILTCFIIQMALLSGCESNPTGPVNSASSQAAVSEASVSEAPQSQSQPSAEPSEYKVHDDQIMGISIELPRKELEDWTVLYGSFNQSVDRGEYAPVDGSSFFFMPMVSGVPFFDIQYYPENTWDQWLKSGKTADEITGKAGSEEIGRSGGMVYLYCPYESDDSGMDDATKKEYQRILDMVPQIKGSIKLTSRAGANTGKLPGFQSVDLSGNPVDSTLFADNTLTMVNIWGTFCGPCIMEMPDLAVMGENMPEGTAIVGLLTDAVDERRVALAKQIVAETGVKYTNILPDSALIGYINEHIVGVPTTIFIDSAGNIVGDALVGARSADGYMKELLARTANLASTSATPTD